MLPVGSIKIYKPINKNWDILPYWVRSHNHESLVSQLWKTSFQLA